MEYFARLESAADPDCKSEEKLLAKKDFLVGGTTLGS